MASARDDYLRALFALSKSDPNAWATFVEAFIVYTVYEFERLLSTPSSEAHIAIGMGRRMRDLRDDFIHIEASAAKLKK